MIDIDGAVGEGGGQVVRSALALALVTGRSVRLTRIRARRPRPGLARQHLTAVLAAAQVSQAGVEGASLGSTVLVFEPGPVTGGDFAFRIGTAGSATLVVQTVLPALLVAERPSTLVVEGGTHNPWAPPADFLMRAFLPLMGRLGPQLSCRLERYGFFPAGGGRLSLAITPVTRLAGLELLVRGALRGRQVRAVVANLPRHIGDRECAVIRRLSGWPARCFEVVEVSECHGPGNVVCIEIDSAEVTEVFTGFGQKGLPAEEVAVRAWREAADYLATDAPVGAHLADQLLVPLAIAAAHGHPSAFRTLELSSHARTQRELIPRFLPIEIVSRVDVAGSCLVEIQPRLP